MIHAIGQDLGFVLRVVAQGKSEVLIRYSEVREGPPSVGNPLVLNPRAD